MVLNKSYNFWITFLTYESSDSSTLIIGAIPKEQNVSNKFWATLFKMKSSFFD